MTQDQVMTIVRSILQIVGTSLVSYSAATGITEQMWATISGGILMIVPVIWGLYAHNTANTIAAASKLPEVAKVVTTPEIANNTLADNPKVTTS
jgi:hypothetical protein